MSGVSEKHMKTARQVLVETIHEHAGRPLGASERAARVIATALANAEREGMRRAAEWRNITDLPTDPIGVELFFAHLPAKHKWSDEMWKGPRDERRSIGWFDGETFCINGTGHDAYEPWLGMTPEEGPTHWRPLASPPASEAGEG